MTLDHETAALRLGELGNVTRLAIFRYLVKAGPGGAPVGQVQEALKVPGSTLTHHLNRMKNAGLISQKREGRILYCQVRYEALDEVMEFLKAECCAGVEPCALGG
jgi:ArsR family transcriptional regulator